MLQGVINQAGFRLALMLFEIALQLLPGFVSVLKKLLPRSESQSTDVAVGDAGCCANESHDPKVALRHRSIVARWRLIRLNGVTAQFPGTLSLPK